MEVKSPAEDPPRPRLSKLQPDPPIVTSFPPTLPRMVERSARLFGDKVFVLRRHSRGGGSVTFAELARDVRTAAAIHEENLLVRQLRIKALKNMVRLIRNDDTDHPFVSTRNTSCVPVSTVDVQLDWIDQVGFIAALGEPK